MWFLERSVALRGSFTKTHSQRKLIAESEVFADNPQHEVPTLLVRLVEPLTSTGHDLLLN